MKFLFSFISFIICSAVFGQFNPILDQYMFNGVAQNPALTGSENALSSIVSFRSQWVGMKGAPQTHTISIHTPLRKEVIAVGIQFYNDKIGITNRTGFFGSMSYTLKLKKSDLKFGMNGGIGIIQNDYSKLDVQHSGDLLLADNTTGVMPNFGFGAYWKNKMQFAGFSIPMILTYRSVQNSTEISNTIRNYNFNFMYGIKFKVHSKVNFQPSVLLKARIQHRPQADINLLFEFSDRFQTGVSYRTEEAIMLPLICNFNRQFSFMYSFGIPLSKLTMYTFGSHELSLKYNFFYKTSLQNPRIL